jgi:hypothetical protein
MDALVRDQLVDIHVALGAADQVDCPREGSMPVQVPNDSADGGSAIAGAFLAALIGSGMWTLAVGLVMLLN